MDNKGVGLIEWTHEKTNNKGVGLIEWTHVTTNTIIRSFIHGFIYLGRPIVTVFKNDSVTTPNEQISK